jgi:mRNA interferase MazF
MITYKRSEVILVKIVFSGEEGYKNRPAVILSVDKFNNNGTKLIVAGITGNLSPPFRMGDTLLKDWSSAGLLKPSAVRGVIATVDKSDVLHKLGKLTKSDFDLVEKNISLILGL